MAITWIEVADSAVKIGLGAVIAGVVALVVPFATFAKEVFADRRRRRLDLIRETLERFIAYVSDEMTHCAAAADCRLTAQDGHVLESVAQRYATELARADDVGRMFNQVIANLELLGLTELSASASGLSARFGSARKIIVSGSTSEVAREVAALREHVARVRNEVVHGLGRYYAMEPELRRVGLLNGDII